jgi:PAS domain S-box-containing protein
MKRRSLLRSVLLLAGLGVALVSLLQLLAQAWYDVAHSERRVLAITEEVAASMLPLLRNTLVVGDLATTQETLDDVARQGHFRHLQLLDARGASVVLEGRAGAAPGGRAAPAWFAALLDRRYPAHRFPVNVGGTDYGVLLAEPSDALLVEDIWRRVELALLLGGVAVVAMWLVLLAALRRGLAPLDDLVGAARDLGRGDLARRAPVSEVPELAVTAEAFNHMAGNVQRLVAEVSAQAATNRRLAEIVAQSSEAIITLDLNGIVEHWNPAATHLLGYSAEEAVGASFGRFLPETPSGMMRAMLSRIRSHAPRAEEDVLLRAKSGAHVETALATAPLFDDGGAHVGEIVIGRDVGERNRAARELRQAKDAAEAANRAKSEFLATMSHEIRTPMNGVLGMTHLVLETELNARQRRYLELAQSSAQALLVILNDILDLSKIEAGKLTLEEVDFSLADLIEELSHLFATQCEQKGIALSHAIGVDVPRAARGDPARLRQVLFNLLGNAVKFTEKGTVSLRVERAADAPGMLRFSVADSGIGMTPEQRARIFQPFVQADGSMTRRYGGTGLGLTICARLVAMMGGRIEVASEAGRGSEFHFTIPLAEAAAPDRPASPRASAPGKAGGGVILLAEDTPVNQLLAVKLLERRGYKVLVAGNGLEATQAYGRGGVDLILMDVHMPVMDGYEAATLIRELEREAGDARHVPIVALTASVMAEDRQRCAEAGMDDFLAKPIDHKALFDCLERHMRGVAPT